ncbi:uncharacterized protein LOC129591419 [Paramacrobiotus metropolitanus]|uniref:uncharacterized protein LOC129591419 n=1 Tax=Paramacrobiotus metropolitanus TaxID=2943436 RepID=UPI0024463694|nr:uncharacterized protein LOC129591419 [Paramacrobiotus metropolitanus]XP_055343042.1 uncharacterized protein LOC129591419 [Paramacrobiotus metropolitanus]XP_055343050.1 uncharacterized protein LOC129591419 [Paramacrobiotus metropolitanus]
MADGGINHPHNITISWDDYLETVSNASSYLDFPPPRYRRGAEELSHRLEELKIELTASAADLKTFNLDETDGPLRTNANGLGLRTSKTSRPRFRTPRTENKEELLKSRRYNNPDSDSRDRKQGNAAVRDSSKRTTGAGNRPGNDTYRIYNKPYCGSCQWWKPTYSSGHENTNTMRLTGSYRHDKDTPENFCRKYVADNLVHMSLRQICTRLLHYRIDISNLPFITSRSDKPGLSRSHSVPANIQQLIGKFKVHNSILCYGTLRKGDVRKLERHYARLYRQYEQIKREIYVADNRTIAEVLTLVKNKSVIRAQLKNLLWILELSRRDALDASAMVRSMPLPVITADKITEGDKKRALLKDLRAAQMLFN